jgi:lipopolysaccharide export LptBFGC system permease protein LptF
MSIFEAAMLFCFGLAWPLSIYRSYKSRRNEGKSLPFLYVVFFGYLSGITHKLLYNLDPVIVLYILNGLMVFIDILLYYRNNRLNMQSGI